MDKAQRNSFRTALHVEPDRVEFRNVEVGVRYSQIVTVRNITAHARRIRFVPPGVKAGVGRNDSRFRLIYDNKLAISPGLAVTVEVEFLTQEPGDFVDRVILTSDDFRFEVPLQATLPCAVMDFTRFLNFGNVVVNKKFYEDLYIWNSGTVEGSFELPQIIDNQNFSLKYKPNEGRVAPMGKQLVQLELVCGETPHTLHELLDIKLGGQSSLVPQMKSLDVHGTILRQNLHVIHDAQEVDQLNFGHIYFGNKKTLTIQLLNDGPTSLSFNAQMQVQSEGDDASMQKGAYAIHPSNGVVPEFGSIPVTVTFKPPVYEETKGFMCTRRPQDELFPFQVTCVVESEELSAEQVINLALNANAVVPAIKALPDTLQFGHCATGDRRDVILTISNNHEILPVNFNIPQTPNYRVEPAMGTLLPRQDFRVIVTFLPKQLGTFNQTLTILYNDEIYSYPVYLCGHCRETGAKPKPVKGLEKVSSDFEPAYHYVNVEELLTTPLPHKRNLASLTKIMKSSLVNGVEASVALDNLLLDQPEPTQYSLAPSAMQEFVKNKQVYNQFLKDSRKERMIRKHLGGRPPKELDIFYEDDANIGLKPGSGLKSPRYSVDDIGPERLWLQRPLESDGDTVRGVTGLRYQHDENKIIKKKFKAAPTTQAEVRDCTVGLEPAQIALISCGPKNIDFGSIFVKSSLTKSFTVYNDLPQCILVSVQFEGIDLLSRSTPQSQVIPSAHVAGFDLTLSSAVPRDLSKTLNYTINGIHTNKLNVTGEVTPVHIQLPTNELKFNFRDDTSTLEKTLIESLVLANNGNAPAKFHWQVPMGTAFSVNPKEGIIKAGGLLGVDVTFNPPANTTNAEAQLVLKTEDGYDQAVTCSGTCPEGNCVFAQKKVDFGVLSVGHTAEKTATLRNDGGSIAVYHVESVIEGVQIQPMKGAISVGSTAELTIHVTLDHPLVLDNVISVSVRGGKMIRLPISAQAVVPNIEIEEPEFEFGQLTLGAISSLPLTLRNSSAVEGSLFINLQAYPEFVLSMGDTHDEGQGVYFETLTYEQYCQLVGAGNPSEGKGKKKDGGAGALFGMSGGGANANLALGGDKAAEADDAEDEESTSIFKITVPANATIPLQLTYQPADLGQHIFELPFVGAGNVKAPGCRRVVHGEALRPRMLFSTTTFDFKTKVVATGIQSVASILELHVHNADDFPLLWKIDVEALKELQGVFHLEPHSGVLAPEEDTVIKCSFLPAEPLTYSVQLPVYLSAPRQEASPAGDVMAPLPIDENAPPYLYVRLKGVGTVPRLTFDTRMIQLPTVPLGVTAKATFNIINEGYESLDAKYRLPAEYGKIPLTIRFPEGQQITLSRTKLLVEVEFCSVKPLSFSAKLEFLDNDNNPYVIPLSGTADNCVLSTWQYLSESSQDYLLEGDQVVQLRSQAKATLPAQDSVDVAAKNAYLQQIGGSAGFLTRWLNGVALRNPIDNFPGDLILQSGKPVFEMIEFLSGKNPQTAQLRAGPAGKPGEGSQVDAKKLANQPKEMQKILQLIQQYEQVLNFCKQHGCLLSMVRPEFLLSQDMFVRYVQMAQLSVSKSGASSKRQLEKAYPSVSYDAWTNLVMQAVKVFLLNRITPKSFRKDLPGLMPEDDENPNVPINQRKVPVELQQCLDVRGMSDSNVYSVAESILLRWLNYHYWKVNSKEKRFPDRIVTNFDTDLQDFIVFAVAIQSHCTHVAQSMNLKCPCTSQEHLQHNCMSVIAALKEIQLQFPLQAQDATNDPNPRDFMLFALFLFQNLPHYVPKTTITFNAVLGVNLTKVIELMNPAKKPVTYSCSLRGSSDFVLQQKDAIKIGERSTCHFPVLFLSKFSRAAEAQITFISKREGNVNAAAISFKLQSRCIGKKPKKVNRMSAVVYEVGTEEIEVENPFPEDAEFKLSAQTFAMVNEFPQGEGKTPASIYGENNNIPAQYRTKSRLANPVDPFHFGSQSVKVKGNSTCKIQISFLPFEVGNFVTQIGFYDPKVGEFYYELQGTSTIPAPLEHFKIHVKVEETLTKEIIIPHRNQQMDKARQWIEAKLVREGKTQQQVAQVLAAIPEKIVYDVKLSSPFCTAPKQVSVSSKQDKQEAKEGEPVSGKLSIEFKPREPGLYPCSITLTSNVDTRIYQIEGTGTAPNTRCSLTFQTHARNEVVQEIPIVNPTAKDWNIKATFTYPPDANSYYFVGPPTLVAKKRHANGQACTTYYVLKFNPAWVCDQVCHLALFNAETNETYEFELTGTADEPVAEDHVVIQCQAREKTDHEFSVKNFTAQACQFEVESDIVHISGPSHVKAGPGDTVQYKLSFLPLQAGNVTGCVMFKDVTTGHFSWYTVEVQTGPSKPQQSLTLTCIVRQAIAVDIQLVNPLDDVIVFDVSLVGDGLLGETEFVLAPRETATYELVFSPFLPSKKRGQAIFVSDQVGEFWYDLELLAQPAPPVELPLLECELGRSVTTEVTIENPTGNEVTLKSKSSNKINFKVLQGQIYMPAFGQAVVEIRYSPSSLETAEEATVTLENPSVGSWVYMLQGMGLAPKDAKEITVVSQINRPASTTITFKNPFLEAVQALVVLDTQAPRGCFALLNKKARVPVAPLGTCQIPVSFNPTNMTEQHAKLIVSVIVGAASSTGSQKSRNTSGSSSLVLEKDRAMSWTYNIKGITEAPVSTQQHPFVIRARETLDTHYTFSLVGLEMSPGESASDVLRCELEVDESHKNLVDKCFNISIAEGQNVQEKNDMKQISVGAEGTRVNMAVAFAPLRPFSCIANLVFTKIAGGGRWRFNLQLEASEPEVDDIIEIESPLNRPASVAFRLCNHTNAYAEFDAMFDSDSAIEFTVTPTSGVLEPAGNPMGTTFIVSYKPTEYGKTVQGKLIIQTEDVMWSYIVRGTHPKYVAPTVDKAKVNTRISRELSDQLKRRQKRNFIKTNISATRSIVANPLN